MNEIFDNCEICSGAFDPKVPALSSMSEHYQAYHIGYQSPKRIFAFPKKKNWADKLLCVHGDNLDEIKSVIDEQLFLHGNPEVPEPQGVIKA